MRIFIVVMIINLMWWAEKILIRDYGIEAMESNGLMVLAVTGILMAVIQDVKEILREEA